jgi:methionine-rich copper-binding protein CopC
MEEKAMQHFVRRMLVPALAITAVTLSASAAGAFVGQPKPEIRVEGERSPQGARLTFKGKNWPASGRVKLTGSRAPGTNDPQDFGMTDVDAKGAFTFKKTVQCSTNLADDAQRDIVTVTAADSSTGVKATTRVEGGAWLCQ